MKKKGNQTSFPDGELQCFVGTREVSKRGSNKNGSSNSPSKRLSDILLMRRFLRSSNKNDGTDNFNPGRPKPGVYGHPPHPSAFSHRLVGQSASSMSSASTNSNLRTNSSSLLMSNNSSSASGGGGYYSSGVVGRYSSRNSSVRSGKSCVSAKSNATVLTAVSSLAGSSSICSSASAVAAYKKGNIYIDSNLKEQNCNNS